MITPHKLRNTFEHIVEFPSERTLLERTEKFTRRKQKITRIDHMETEEGYKEKSNTYNKKRKREEYEDTIRYPQTPTTYLYQP